MKATFIELPPFERHRQSYLNDESFRWFQKVLMENPEAGDVIEGTGGLRKIRHADEKRGKGKRGGLRLIYYWWQSGEQFWLFTVYSKDEMEDLTAPQKKVLKDLLKQELDARRAK
jgi:mRNA-degrading endonuclease RelE of RelBE toxin-antitoxin system